VNESNFRYCYRCGFTLPVITDEGKPVFPEETEPMEQTLPVEEVFPVEEPIPVEESIPAEEPAPIPEPEVPQPPVKKGRLLPPLLLLLAMMAIGLLAFFASPQNTEEPKPVTGSMPWFSVSNGVLSFDESLYDGDSELVVPSKVNGQTVTVIGKGCFKECRSLTTVILPETVTEIRQQAFSDCTNLRGIFIPEGVKTIDGAAFHNCLVLEAVHLPESLQTLDSRAFSRCRKLVHVFYAGTYENWTNLYTGILPVDAWIYCEDGNFPYTQE
jgi:hypothetical protein